VPGPPLLRTERLTRAYGSLLAVNGVDFAVNEGELVQNLTAILGEISRRGSIVQHRFLGV
jgi:ABC-type branched-subunit amino acid transport system ATPase component